MNILRQIKEKRLAMSLSLQKNNRIYKLLHSASEQIKKKFKFDDEGLYSFTNLSIGDEFAAKLLSLPKINRNSIIIDLFGGLGGSVISLAKQFTTVHTTECDNERFSMLRYNISLFKLTNVVMYNGCYEKYIKNLFCDIVFIDPPWGVNYKQFQSLRLYITTSSGRKSLENACIDIIRTCKPKYLALKLPLNYDVKYFIGAVEEDFNLKIVGSLEYSKPNSMRIILIAIA